MAAWPTADDFKAWLRLDLDDDIDDVAIGDSQAAAASWIESRVRPSSLDPLAPDLRLAHLMLTQRHVSRRNSPDGVVGFGELGGIRIGRSDPDIEELVGPHRVTVVA